MGKHDKRRREMGKRTKRAAGMGNYGRGTCPSCKGRAALDVNGKLKPHSRKGIKGSCYGTGLAPVEG